MYCANVGKKAADFTVYINFIGNRTPRHWLFKSYSIYAVFHWQDCIVVEQLSRIELKGMTLDHDIYIVVG